MRFAVLERRIPPARPSLVRQAETTSAALGTSALTNSGMARRARSAVVAVMALLASGLLLALGLLLTACSRKRISDAAEAMDARAVRRYSEVLVRTGGAGVAIERCSMFAGTRNAHCALRGAIPELFKLTSALGLTKAATKPVFKPSCLDFEGFGRKLGSPPTEYRDVKPGVERFVPGTAALPPNENNVKFLWLYVAPDGSACAEFTFPYG